MINFYTYINRFRRYEYIQRIIYNALILQLQVWNIINRLSDGNIYMGYWKE